MSPNSFHHQEQSLIRTLLMECRWLFAGAFLFSFFINILMLAVPLYSMQVLDRVLSSGSLDTLLMLTLIVAAALLFMGVLQGIRSLVFNHISRWLEDRFSAFLVRCSMEQALQRSRSGLQPLQDLERLKEFMTSPALSSLFDAPWAILYFIVIFMIQTILGVTVVLGALLMLGLALLAERLPSKKVVTTQEARKAAAQILESLLQNAQLVHAMGLLERAEKKWQGYRQEAAHHSFSMLNLNTILSSTTRTMRMAFQVILTGLGAWLVLKGKMSPGGIIAVSILAGKALAPFDAFVSIYHQIVLVKKAAKNLNTLSWGFHASKKALWLPSPQGMVTLEGLSYQDPLSGHWILRGLTAHFPAGTTVGIIGASGSGKTTLARLLVGVLKPTAGCVRLEGAALDQWNPDQLGPLMGYLPQTPILFDGTVRENIARLDSTKEDAAVVRAARLAGIHKRILEFPNGYQTELGGEGILLSAGQRQRIALARSFFGLPKWVVLDEPDTHLDAEGREALLQCLKEAKQQGITLFIVTHCLSLIRQTENLLLLQKGMAQFCGPTQEALTKGRGSGRSFDPILSK